MWAERERPICRLALKPIFVTPAPCSALAQAFSGMSAHRSAPAHPVFCPLPVISTPLSAHVRCSYARLGEALSAVVPETELVQNSYKQVIHYLVILFAQERQFIIAVTSCAGGRHNIPRPLQVDLWPWKWCVVGWLCANFVFLGLCSRLRPDVREIDTVRQTDRRHTRIIA